MGGMGFIENNKALCMLSVLINTHLVMASKDAGVNRYFYASSACVYAADKQTDPNVTALKEEDAYPAMPEDGYGWEKLFSERMCRHFREDFGLETRVARYHNVYGPHGTYEGGREKAPAAICRKVIEAKLSGKHEIEIWGDGKQTRSFQWIDDCVKGTQMIMEGDCVEPLNLGSSELVSINQLVDIVEEIAGVKLKRSYNLSAPKGVNGRNSDNTLIEKFSVGSLRRDCATVSSAHTPGFTISWPIALPRTRPQVAVAQWVNLVGENIREDIAGSRVSRDIRRRRPPNQSWFGAVRQWAKRDPSPPCFFSTVSATIVAFFFRVQALCRRVDHGLGVEALVAEPEPGTRETGYSDSLLPWSGIIAKNSLLLRKKDRTSGSPILGCWDCASSFRVSGLWSLGCCMMALPVLLFGDCPFLMGLGRCPDSLFPDRVPRIHDSSRSASADEFSVAVPDHQRGAGGFHADWH